MNSEVDVNILVNLYYQKISALTNKNILLTTNFELQQHNDEILKLKRKIKPEDKYQEAGIQQ
jgi:hypothetical protein